MFICSFGLLGLPGHSHLSKAGDRPTTIITEKRAKAYPAPTRTDHRGRNIIVGRSGYGWETVKTALACSEHVEEAKKFEAANPIHPDQAQKLQAHMAHAPFGEVARRFEGKPQRHHQRRFSRPRQVA